MSDSQHPDLNQVVNQLQTENQQLRQELQNIRDTEARGARQRKTVLKVGWSVLFPLFDRKRVVRSFMQLMNTVSGFSSPREDWPEREKVIDDTKAFALSMLRFTIRRRTLMFLLGMTAFVIPGIQIWLVYQQNEIIKGQNRFFEVQVYDIAARGLTSGTQSSRQVTSALLAKTELDLLRGMVEGVFEADIGGSFTAADIDARSRKMRQAAFRGYLIGALDQQLRENTSDASLEELDAQMRPMFRAILRDAQYRVPELMRIPHSAAADDPALAEEVSNYLTKLVELMRTHWTLASSLGEEKVYFAAIAPLMARASGRRSSFASDQSPFEDVLFKAALIELFIDMAQGRKFGEPIPQIASDKGTVDKLVRDGFERLKVGIGEQARVNWNTLKSRAGIK